MSGPAWLGASMIKSERPVALKAHVWPRTSRAVKNLAEILCSIPLQRRRNFAALII
jgi:hypothetical protein